MENSISKGSMKRILCIALFLVVNISLGLFANIRSEYNVRLHKMEKKMKQMDDGFDIRYLLNRILSVEHDIESKGILYNSEIQNLLLTGYDYVQFYDWDLYFENLFQVYNGEVRFCFSNLSAFFACQEDNGFIKRSFGTYEYGSDHMFKPFVAQTVYLGMKNYRNINFLTKYYDNIVRYEYAWYELFDKDNNLLCVWNNADHSGMDNQTSRVLEGLVDEGVDLNCYLYREFVALSELAKMLGKPIDARKFSQRADDIKVAINKYLWDEESGFYYDRNEKTGQLNMVKGISGFIPLFSEIASRKQAKRLVYEHLLCEDEFWSKYPVCTLAMNEPNFNSEGSQPPSGYCNWNGTTWIPINYMIFHGLMKYGYMKVAKDVAYKTFELVCMKNKPYLREYYSSQTGEGYGRNPFYGWSSLAYIMPLEYEFKYSPTDLSNEECLPLVNWLKDYAINKHAE